MVAGTGNHRKGTLVKIGWLHDDLGIVGGAELSERTLRAGAPEWAEIVLCPPNKRPPEDIEAFIIQNCTAYPVKWIEVLEKVPVIKQNRDAWWSGSIVLRRWLLDNAKLLLFSSQMQADNYEHWYENEYAVVPPPVNLDMFREAALPDDKRQGTIWVGRTDPGKGLHTALDWAWREQEPIDIYGDLSIRYINFAELGGLARFHGRAPYESLPAIYGAAKRYVFFPTHKEPFGRTVAEAWASGCELLVDGFIGALEWIEQRPDDIGRGVEMFWNEVERTLEP